MKETTAWWPPSLALGSAMWREEELGGGFSRHGPFCVVFVMGVLEILARWVVHATSPTVGARRVTAVLHIFAVFLSRAREARCFLRSRKSCAVLSLSGSLPWESSMATVKVNRIRAELQRQGATLLFRRAHKPKVFVIGKAPSSWPKSPLSFLEFQDCA